MNGIVTGKNLPKYAAQLVAAAALILISCSHLETVPSAAEPTFVPASEILAIQTVQNEEEIPVEEATPDLLPARCRWNLTGTYAVASPFSKKSAALRYEVWDDGTTLTISASVNAGGSPSDSKNSAADKAGASMEFVRGRDGFLHRTLKRISMNGDADDASGTCEVPFTAKIIDCDRTHLIIELDRAAAVDANCVVAERETPENLRLVRANSAAILR